ncbi:MAG: hypothetical protein U5K43_10830 [Halofilum sp. (in: g-proteobacteria)]|nr:hypothetical protein [Halofilum sp. (in: g-proteobacteria)]
MAAARLGVAGDARAPAGWCVLATVGVRNAHRAGMPARTGRRPGHDRPGRGDRPGAHRRRPRRGAGTGRRGQGGRARRPRRRRRRRRPRHGHRHGRDRHRRRRRRRRR